MIIDSLCYVPTEEVLVDMVASLPDPDGQVLERRLRPESGPLMGLTAEELYRMKTGLGQAELKKELAPKMKPLSMSLEDFVKQLDDMDVKRAVIFNLDEETPSGLTGLPNDYYADIVKQYPDKFIGIAGIDPLKGMDAVREIRRSYDLGLRGVGIRPFMFGIPPTHAKMYPIYSPAWNWTCRSGSTCRSTIQRTTWKWRDPFTWTWWPRISPS